MYSKDKSSSVDLKNIGLLNGSIYYWLSIFLDDFLCIVSTFSLSILNIAFCKGTFLAPDMALRWFSLDFTNL